MIFASDHFVLSVRSVEETGRFYERALGLKSEKVPGRPAALKYGDQKINVHELGHEFEPKAAAPMPGASDFCLITVFPMDEVERRLTACGVAIELGPIERSGAQGAMISIYFRDPDGKFSLRLAAIPQTRIDDPKTARLSFFRQINYLNILKDHGV